MINSIKLRFESIFQVPFESYPQDFTFIVNGQEYQTNRFYADLLSPVVSKTHQQDPTQNEMIIKTKTKGNFENIMNLTKFEEQEIKVDQIPFITEILKTLGMTNVYIKNKVKKHDINNIVETLEQAEKYRTLYDSEIESDLIGFLSSHFHEVLEKEENKERMKNLSYDTLCRVINNCKLEVEDEDEILKFFLYLYKSDKSYSPFFEYVLFENLRISTIEEFIEEFEYEDMTSGTWKSLTNLLLKIQESGAQGKKQMNNDDDQQRHRNYLSQGKKTKAKSKGKEISSSNGIGGIFKYFQNESNIDEEVKFTYSSREGGDVKLLLNIESTNNNFYTANKLNEWICFEFKKHKVIPTGYSIRSINRISGKHPRSWEIEGSEDGKTWVILDSQINNQILNGANIVHTFSIEKQNETEIKFIRMKLTDHNWFYSNNNYRIGICSIEFYGYLI